MTPFPTSPARPLRPFTAGLLVSVTVSVARANLFPFLGLFLLSSAVAWSSAELAWAALGPALEGWEDAADRKTLLATVRLYSYIPGGILGLLLTAAICHRTVRFLEGSRAPILESLKIGLFRLPAVAGIGIVTHLPSLLGRLLPALGYHSTETADMTRLLLFGLSGLLLHLLFFLAVPVAVIETPGVARSLARSLSLAKGGWYPIFLCILGVGLLLCSSMTLTIWSMGHRFLSPLLHMLFELSFFLVYQLLPGVAYVLLRKRKEDVPVAELARTFS